MTLQVDLVEKFQWVDGHADLWPWFSDADVFARIIEALAAPFTSRGITKVVGIESRAFLLAGAVARELRAGVVPIRKRGAVFPGPHYSQTTSRDWQGRQLELLLQRQSLRSTDRLLLVDDWIETGSQVVAAVDLVIEAGAQIEGVAVIVDESSPEVRSVLSEFHALINAEVLATPR